MGTDDFSAYAAMVSVLGVLGTGVAGAMEQETSRRVATAAGGSGPLRPPIAHSAAAAALAAVVVLLPTGWQQALFAERAPTAAVLVVVGVLALHAAAIGRGALAGSGHRAQLGLAIALTGMLPVVLGGLLVLVGVDGFLAFGLGTVLGGGSGALVALPVLRILMRGPREGSGQAPSRLGRLVAANLFLTANMVAVPAVLRVHVDDLSASVVASLQIVVSLSRLSTLLVANAVSVVVAAVSRDHRSRTVLRYAAGATAFGVVAVLSTAVLAPVLLPLVFGPGYEVDVGLAALAAVSVVFLNPAYILTGVAVARGRDGLIAWAWAGGAVVLGMVAGWRSPPGAAAILTGIAVSAALPTMIMGSGLAVARSRSQWRDAGVEEEEESHRAQ